jgi:hypothetical protein
LRGYTAVDVGTGDCISLSGNSTTPVPVSASAVFQVGAGNTLDITLINDAGSSATQLGGADTLTALLFNLAPAGGTLTNVGGTGSLTAPLIGTATLTTSSGGKTVGQEWALATGINAYTFSNLYSLTSNGLNGPPGATANLCTSGCSGLGGPASGLTPASNLGGVAPGVGINLLIQYYAYFTLPGLAVGLTNAQLKADLSDVVFQYGTGSSDATGLSCTSCGGTGNTVPEPSQIVFLLVSGLLIGFISWRRRVVA